MIACGLSVVAGRLVLCAGVNSLDWGLSVDTGCCADVSVVVGAVVYAMLSIELAGRHIDVDPGMVAQLSVRIARWACLGTMGMLASGLSAEVGGPGGVRLP